jgi:hypothetical protein
MLWRGKAAVAAGLIPVGVVTATPTAQADDISSAFAAPARSQLPLYRFWNGGGSLDPATFNRELDEMAANGAGGIEASTLSTQNTMTDPDYTTPESFGTPLWTRRVTDLINTITPDGPGSAKEITFGRVWVTAGASYSGPVPTATCSSFGPFTPGVAKEYTVQTTANVTSTAGDAALSVADPGHLTNEPVAIAFKQHINADDALRTGTYKQTLTFTLSTTTP